MPNRRSKTSESNSWRRNIGLRVPSELTDWRPAITTLRTLAALLISPLAIAQQTPTPAAAPWWNLTTALSNDSMKGRDTGTEDYQRAAELVAAHFKADGLQPAGDNGTFFQRVPMHEVDLDTGRSSIELLPPAGQPESLKLLYETTLSPRADLPPLTEGQLVFIGYGIPPAGVDLHGKIAVFFNNIPADLPANERNNFPAARLLRLAESGAAGFVSIDNPAAIEPTHWPAAYARTVTLLDHPQKPQPNAPIGIRISAEAAPKLFANTPDADAAKILANAEHGLPLPTLPLTNRLRIRIAITEKDIASPNIIAVLPGSDPSLKPEYVALSAHLDGYGFGTPVNGDNLYNGALDDAAYVATLLDMAHTLASEKRIFTRTHGQLPCDMSSAKPCPPAPVDSLLPKRSLLFCIFTGEEKGLLGSEYFTHHPTVPAAQIVADLNLDQLRPIFPLNILTMEGIADSTLGETARQVAANFHIKVRPDREPERNLFRRADNYNFVRIGVPIASFIFGYDPGTPEERAYRNWYATRYHKPQDDLTTPIDWAAAVKFNEFYRALTLAVANAPMRPNWLPASAYAPKPVPGN